MQAVRWDLLGGFSASGGSYSTYMTISETSFVVFFRLKY